MAASANEVITLSGVAVVMLVDHLREHQAWGWMRLAQGASPLKEVPGLVFSKVMGSGHGGGFGLRPSATHQGFVGLFDSFERAQAFLDGPYVAAARERAQSHWCGLLQVVSSRGQWDGQAWGVTPPAGLGALAATADTRPLAALTRASIRPAKAMAFWRNAPAAQNAMKTAEGCQLAMGLGEAPLVRQCTFSLWRDTPSMLAYAHQGAHQQAIEAAYRHHYFSESMFVRMRLLAQHGAWPAPPRVEVDETEGQAA